MDANTCNINRSNADALLPPRKRLLAGLKRQNPEVNSPVSLPSTPRSVGTGHGSCLNIYRFQLNNPNLSDEGILEASRISALEAARVAETARAYAEEKAAKAARAVAVAKSALELVASLSNEAADDDEESLKKNKMKKHIYVEALYNNKKDNTSCRSDEELARRLHQVINSSPRILKNSPGLTNYKHKKPKHSANDVVMEELNAGDHIKKIDMSIANLNTSNHNNGIRIKLDNREQHGCNKTDGLKLEKGKVGMILSNSGKSASSLGQKRGKLTQKKLPLSICSFRDQISFDDNAMRTTRIKQSSFSTDNILMPVERTSSSSVWKCQSLKVRSCVNKVMQS